jgi:hypothetical protein
MYPESNGAAPPTELSEGFGARGGESAQFLDESFGIDQSAIRIILDAFLRLPPTIASRQWLPQALDAEADGGDPAASQII